MSPVELSFQRYVLAFVTNPKATELAVHGKTALDGLIESVGRAVSSVIIMEASAVQPFTPVIVTPYVSAVVTVMLAVVAPVLQTFVPEPNEVSVIAVLAQVIVVELDEINGFGGAKFEVTIENADAVQPFEPVPTTVNNPPAGTKRLAVVSPEFHK